MEAVWTGAVRMEGWRWYSEVLEMGREAEVSSMFSHWRRDETGRKTDEDRDKGDERDGERLFFLPRLYVLSLLCCLGTVALEVEKSAERRSRGRIQVEDAVCMLIKLNAN